jgi:dTDP-4-amino-4,6-dideoxygalactose transaminase
MTQSMQLPFVDLAAQRAALGDELREAFLTALDRGDYILGSDVAAFEAEFAAYCGVRHAIGVDSGTSALELALRAHGVGAGDDVVLPANTFVATAFAVYHCGANPVLVDVDEDTALMDVELLREAITPATKAIMPVHLYGQPADMDAINAIADEHSLAVVEDACQAHGARYRGRRAGALGSSAAFSFYPGKNLGAHGDGGIVVTDDDEVAERVRLLRNYGQLQKYRSESIGYNRRLDTVQAAGLRVKLRHLDDWNGARRAHAARYAEALAQLDLGLPGVRDEVEMVWHLFVVRLGDRDGTAARLGERGIQTGIHYPIPIHLQPACRDLGYARGDFPVTERLADAILSLPMYPELPSGAAEHVAATMNEMAIDTAA